MRRLLIPLLLVALSSGPAAGDQTDSRLDALFAQLKSAADEPKIERVMVHSIDRSKWLRMHKGF